jgi:DNA (cytosine-5)-methyltransferase 1
LREGSPSEPLRVKSRCVGSHKPAPFCYNSRMSARAVACVDLFCGAGGLTHGLRRAGVQVVAGIDLDPACKHPFEHNSGAPFYLRDISTISGADLAAYYPQNAVRLLAGCAPCSPFSPFRHGEDTSKDSKWRLLGEFERLIAELQPELVTMENVPGLATKPIFDSFVNQLTALHYNVAWGSLYCPRYRVPQHRRRLVLLASRISQIRLPPPRIKDRLLFPTVKHAIARLRAVAAGSADPRDPLHCARSVNDLNLRRLRASRPGGTWHDWPEDLRSPCHRRATGGTFHNVYARMHWDEPAPTITTEAYNFGTGRFGHPDQDRSITLREAAILQTFPRKYSFVAAGSRPGFLQVGRLIGNAVPPKLAHYIGLELLRSAKSAAA